VSILIKKYGDIISGSFVLLVAIGLFIASANIKQFNVVKLGADFVPRLTAVFLVILGIALIVNGVKSLKEIKNLETKQEEKKEETPDYISVAVTLILLLIYVILLEKIGFIIMTSLFLFIQFIILSAKSQRKYMQFALISMITSVSAYYLFVSVFQVMIPAGILG